MAQVQILGDAFVITSTLKYEDIQLVQRVRPKALNLYEETETGKVVPIFRIAAAGGKFCQDDINEYGIVFRKGSHDGGFAQITAKVPGGDASPRELVAMLIEVPLMNLNRLEYILPDVIDEINAQKQEVLDSIEVL